MASFCHGWWRQGRRNLFTWARVPEDGRSGAVPPVAVRSVSLVPWHVACRNAFLPLTGGRWSRSHCIHSPTLISRWQAAQMVPHLAGKAFVVRSSGRHRRLVVGSTWGWFQRSLLDMVDSLRFGVGWMQVCLASMAPVGGVAKGSRLRRRWCLADGRRRRSDAYGWGPGDPSAPGGGRWAVPAGWWFGGEVDASTGQQELPGGAVSGSG